MLTALNLELCPRIGNEGLGAIGRLYTRLQSISIKECPLIGDRGIASLISSPLSVLNRIKLQNLNITDFSLAMIGHYGRTVSNLFLGGLKNTTEEGFWVMGNTKGLKRVSSLTVVSCRGIADFSLEAIARGCISLKQICLRKCCSISDNGVVALTRNATSLEILQLDELRGITLAGIAGMISSCGKKMRSLSLVNCNGVKDFAGGASILPISRPSLRSLSVRNCTGFGNAGLTMVGSLCPSLKHLDLTGLCGITDAGLLPLLEKCEGGLIKVNLSGCFNVTNKAIATLVRQNGGTLELLNLDGCRKVTDESLVAISDNCFVLNDLDLSKCAITDSGITALSESIQPNLQVLSLSGCSEVTDESASSLGLLARNLLGMNLQHCLSISNSTVEFLAEISWRCDIIS
ncbi:hypothetical protein MLD38_005766 [Melastoma candidum]|nr:hypothetical protein MLD38_005766 [Melastoma candidum]